MAHEKLLTPQRELLRQELNALQAAVADDADGALPPAPPPVVSASSDAAKVRPAKTVRPRVTRKQPPRREP